MHYVVSAVRLAYDDANDPEHRADARLARPLGELLYSRQTPDGYPLDEAAWASSGQMATRFEIARAIGSGSAGLFKAEGATTETPAFPRLASALLLRQRRADLEQRHPRGARPRHLAAGVEHLPAVVARVHDAMRRNHATP